MDLEGIMLSEISQTEKEKYHMISHICGIKHTHTQINGQTKPKQTHKEQCSGYQGGREEGKNE